MMTLDELRALPIGTRVQWRDVMHGVIIEPRDAPVTIRWADGSILSPKDSWDGALPSISLAEQTA